MCSGRYSVVASDGKYVRYECVYENAEHREELCNVLQLIR
jgi:hypothetical protein